VFLLPVVLVVISLQFTSNIVLVIRHDHYSTLHIAPYSKLCQWTII